jgi:hypothetical protein
MQARLMHSDHDGSISRCISAAKKSGDNTVGPLLMGTDEEASRKMTQLNIRREFSPGTNRILAHAHSRVHRYLDSAPLVADKLLVIAALLAVYLLPDGTNPLRRVFDFIRGQDGTVDDEESFEPFAFQSLSSQEHFILLTFSQSLVEQIPKAKQSQQDRYRRVQNLQVSWSE